MQFSNNSTTALLMKMNQNNLRCKLLENAGNYRIMLAQMRYIKHALYKKKHRYVAFKKQESQIHI